MTTEELGRSMPLDGISRTFLKVLYPWFPLWAFVSVITLNLPLNKVVILPAICLAVWIAIAKTELYVPRFLKFLVLFTCYHLVSSIYSDSIPSNTTFILYTLSDYSVLSCFLLFIVCNTAIDETTIAYFDKQMFYVILLSLIVSLIQVKYNDFFATTAIPEVTSFKVENRLTSIYSWYDLNSVGITFPIYVALVLAHLWKKEWIRLALILLSLLAVSFLTKARYVMISGLIAASQLFFSNLFEFKQKIQIMVISVLMIVLCITIANQLDYSIEKVVDERILERSQKYSSALARITSLDVFLYVFPNHPWFGVGPTTRDDVRLLLGEGIPVIHVGYLSYLYYYGVFGSAFLFISIGLLLIRSYSVGRITRFWGVFYALLTFCFANSTFVYFNFTEPGIVMSIIYLEFYTRNITAVGD